MKQIDLSFLKEDPSEKTKSGYLIIEPLAPLSMNTSLPGKHYQTERHPPERQILGMFENALGLHFGWSVDYKLRKEVADDAAADIKISGVDKRDFQPILSLYLELERVEEPEVATFDDVQWAHKWRDSAQSRAGAMNHDWRAVGDDPVRYGYGKTVIRREHVVAAGAWIYSLRTTPAVFERLKVALKDPEAPLYLGNNDGWIDARLTEEL